jgi:geranylgeranyl pyrophosphate synthase
VTQPLIVEPSACGKRRGAAGQSALAALIRSEFEGSRLSETLDAKGELVALRHFERALAGPLVELLDREGKSFRSRMVQVAFDLSAGGQGSAPPQLPLIVEALHAGSLIVDDIEDDSPRRRGGPALHLTVGVPLALNAGNWLYFLPHRLLEDMQLDAQCELELRRAIERAVLRCHYGQALDLGVRLGSLAQSEVHGFVSLSTRLKTGSLLELAAELGSIAGGATPDLRRELASFGRCYGVALQMLDDASGLYRPERAQKGREDLLNGSPTWPWAWLAGRLDELGYSRLAHQSQAVVKRELEPEVLAAGLKRKLGNEPQRRVHDELEQALGRLKRAVRDPARLEPLVEEIERLEAAYV